jgi:hypothetical protein
LYLGKRALQEYAYQKRLEDIEADLPKHFDGSLSAEEKANTPLVPPASRQGVLH